MPIQMYITLEELGGVGTNRNSERSRALPMWMETMRAENSRPTGIWICLFARGVEQKTQIMFSARIVSIHIGSGVGSLDSK